MEDFLLGQIFINLFLQRLPDWFFTIMRGFSILGDPLFYLIFMPFLYWCISSSIGLRVGLMLLVSNAVVIASKMIMHWPRPYWLDPQVKGLDHETFFGIPSGHAANAASVWGVFAVSLRRKLLRILIVVLIFLISFSRLVLGTHFLIDVITGWVLGAVLVILFVRLEKPAANWFNRLVLRQQYTVAIFSSFMLMLPSMFISWLLKDWALPNIWMVNARHAIDPLNIEEVFTMGGTWAGFLVGFAWIRSKLGTFNEKGTISQKGLRFLVGIVGVLALYAGLNLLFPSSADAVGLFFRYIRYFTIGFWVAGAAPLLFFRLKLAHFT